jgi:hypothetical protein
MLRIIFSERVIDLKEEMLVESAVRHGVWSWQRRRMLKGGAGCGAETERAGERTGEGEIGRRVGSKTKRLHSQQEMSAQQLNRAFEV